MRYKSANNKHLVRLLALFPVLALALSGCIYRPAAVYRPRVIGIVTAATGTPSIERYNEHFLIGVQSLIYQGDIIETDADSRARIRMIDHAVIHLGSDTHLVIHRFDYNPDNSTSSASMTFTSGAIRIDSGGKKVLRSPDFRIETPLASVRVRCLDFWAGFNDRDTRLELLLLKGNDVAVTNDQGSIKIDSMDFGTSVIAGGTPEVPMRWTAHKRARAIRETSIR